MDQEQENISSRACWFVGAFYDGHDDQTQRFIEHGVWENRYQDKYLDAVRSVQPGDRIAIKASYVRKHDLPFDNRGHSVSVMAIKAKGTVTENLGDGRRLKVDWTKVDPVREWYFYTNRRTVWRVLPGEWLTDALIGFAFEEKPQDLALFRNDPFWQERFGDTPEDKRRFLWTRFYEAVADRLLSFRDKRSELVDTLHAISKRVDCMSILTDQYAAGGSGPLKDVCPFTVMAIFNRGITDENRKTIAGELAKALGVEESVPTSFEGIPIVNNQRTWFFAYEKDRQPGDIDALWEIFEQAIQLSESENDETRRAFLEAYDNAAKRLGVGWNLTMGLYWIRPWAFLTLDSQSRLYIDKKLRIKIGLHGLKGRSSGADYLTVLDSIESRFKENPYPVHSFPELSYAAWLYKDDTTPKPEEENENEQPENGRDPSEETVPAAPIDPYSVNDILKDGCFLQLSRLNEILERLRTKKNIILQGPPGTGKTWLSKRLAFALMGQRHDANLRAVQFHPNLSYEDFVRGWRPSGEGKLSLIDGPFMEMVNSALDEPDEKHVIVIEEINRGNPAQVFGEMLTLLEADKRTPSEALELSYRRSDREKVFIPANLFVIGTMNIADRSLALVDLALRRRFAFVDLEPSLGKTWHNWVHKNCGISAEVLAEIQTRILSLNEEISVDPNLGQQFRIGHSYVTPHEGLQIRDAREWFLQVVKTEIGPLLDEYWFDDHEKAQKARQKLAEGF